MRNATRLLMGAIAAWALLGPGAPVRAQDTGEGDAAAAEEIVVTGSYIKRKSFRSSSPISVIGKSDIDSQGVPTITDIVKNLTINTGSEFNSDIFTQVLTPGSANVNLRGLGLSSTLVLVNGRRQTVAASVSNDGSSFVDINSLMPLIMVERIETLKDGAAALYGSDAVAGVVNFITRSKFEGAEIGVDFQHAANSSQNDVTVDGIVGLGNDRGHVVMAFSYLDRSRLGTGERDFPAGTGISGLGQPGALIPTARPVNPPFDALFDIVGPGVPFQDPGCGTLGGIDTNPDSPFGTCLLDFSRFFALVPKESRVKGFAQATYQINDSVEFFSEFGFSRNRVEVTQTPSTPNLTFPIIPASNPGNFLGVPAVLLGRAIGATMAGVPFPDTQNPVNNGSDTYRAVAGLRGDLPVASGWTWESAFSWSENNFTSRFGDTLKDRFNAALNGLGGPNCDPLTGTPGVGNCKFFDISAAGQATNDPEVIADFTGFSLAKASTQLITVDGHITGDLGDFFTLPGGPIGVAIGGQYRHEELKWDWDDNYNRENFTFLIGGPDFGGSRDIGAFFLELSLPVFENFEISTSVRYEDYGGGINSTDPKVAVLWQPLPELVVRGSFSTAFRAPSLFQTVGFQTVVEEITDPITGSRVFRPVRTIGGQNLNPEDANVYNIGTSWSPTSNVTLSVDFWRFEYSGLITKQNGPQLVLDDPLNPQIIRDPLSNQISKVLVRFINAAAVNTDGLDFGGSYSWDADALGFFRFGFEATYVSTFNLQETPGGPIIKGAGNRNFTNFARSVPRWRGNATVNWALGNHTATVIVRYIDSYKDDQNNAKVGSHATLDLQYTFTLPRNFFDSDAEPPVLTLGAINVTDNNPPRVATNGGFDSKVHDPRGRLFYAKVTHPF